MSENPVPCPSPPEYDIDAILDVDLTVPYAAFQAAFKAFDAIETVPKSDECTYFRPDSSLLYPELITRDLIGFSIRMGNGWIVSLDYSGGIPMFFRGLRALREVGHVRGIAMAERVLQGLKKHGIPELTTFNEGPVVCGWRDDWGKEMTEALEKYDWDMGQIIKKEIEADGLDLDSDWFDLSDKTAPDDPSVENAICMYLDRHRESLRSRKPR